MNNIERQIKKLYKAVKGKVNVSELIKFLERHGYSVVFFHTEEGDELLRMYGIPPDKAKAFTVCGTVKIVFIDDTMHTNDKLYSLLHECGHILLGHLDIDKAHTLDNRRNENDAEVFAYKFLHYSNRRILRAVNLILAIAALVLCMLAFLHVLFIGRASLVDLDLYGSVRFAEETETVFVYVTVTGTKYHKEGCIYSGDAIKISKQEAEKIYEPCMICNP